MKTIQRKDFTEVGSVVKVHGNKGELKFRLSREIKIKEWAFLEFRGKPVPFYIEHTKAEFAGDMVMKLGGINSVDAAANYIGKVLLLPNKSVKKEAVVDEWAINGFMAVDGKLGELGMVEEVIEYPYQSLARIVFNNRDLLIPLVGEIIIEIDDKKKILRVQLPEGLIDINS
ncbi:MAG: hypothetical protein SGJ00_01720 [bacterium]|nr:hypothetical protein [bacterium]